MSGPSGRSVSDVMAPTPLHSNTGATTGTMSPSGMAGAGRAMVPLKTCASLAPLGSRPVSFHMRATALGSSRPVQLSTRRVGA